MYGGYFRCLFIITMIACSLTCIEFQEALSKSNEVFETFKQEIEKVNLISLKYFICSRLKSHLCWTISYLDECNSEILCLFLYCGCNNQMAKSIKELKKENQFLKSKSEKSDVTLIELVDEVHSLGFLFVLDHLPFMHFIRKRIIEKKINWP